jgi:hypothetical protein
LNGKDVSRRVRKQVSAANVKTSRWEKFLAGVVVTESLLAKLFGDDTIPPSET